MIKHTHKLCIYITFVTKVTDKNKDILKWMRYNGQSLLHVLLLQMDEMMES